MILPDLTLSPTGAIFSKCEKYRPVLWRYWGPGCLFLHICGLNPSTATDIEDDPTIRREIDFAKRWKFDGLLKTNAFDFRATLPEVMKMQDVPSSPDNDGWIAAAAKACGISVAAWGVHGNHRGRGDILTARYTWKCFGKTKDGHPKHPLYLPKTTNLTPFN